MCQESDYPTVQRFGQKLRALRQRDHLTTRQLAGKLGVSNAHISDLENGKTKPGADLVLRVAKCFAVSTDVLLDDARDLDL
jgi:transcriptional regulator with XRE-family HTH domain